MKILLLSDTHGYIDERILHYATHADEVWHAGDFGNETVAEKIQKTKPLQGVYGNIDGQKIRQMFPLDNRFTRNGLDIWITHIGGYPGRYEKRVRDVLQINPPNIFVCGHSHILKVMHDTKYNMLTLNPGAAGRNGFHQMRTMLQFEINNGKPENLSVIELGRRVG
ncbi:MAG: metallophosphoesterase family protein [Chitinophagales bacterium]